MHPIKQIFSYSQYIGGEDELEFFDGQYWLSESDTCHYCLEEHLSQDKPPRENETRYSLGLYAGRYCDECWETSGYRKEGPEGYDYLDAGEYYDEY